MKLDASLIADLPTFSDLSSGALSNLIEHARAARYPAGSRIFTQGEEPHSFFILLDGHIRVVKTAPNGEQIIARYISAGEPFGIAQALNYKEYPADAVAAVDCVALAFPASFWEEVVRCHPEFAKRVYAAIGSRLQDTQDRLIELATERVERRVANAILKLAGSTGRKTEEGMLIDMPLSRQDISEMTGTTLHTVSRLLSAWEQDGIVKSARRKVTVRQSDRLLKIAGGV